MFVHTETHFVYVVEGVDEFVDGGFEGFLSFFGEGVAFVLVYSEDALVGEVF